MTVDTKARRDGEFSTKERDYFGPVWQEDPRTGYKVPLVYSHHLSL